MSTRRPKKPRGRKLLAAAALLALGVLFAARREPDASAGSGHHKHPRTVPGAPKHARRGVAHDSPWASPEACLAALSRGGAPRAAGKARVGAWNLHWFPDGRAGAARPGGGADLEWLACAITWMKLDVLAVEEIKRPPRGDEGLAALRQRLDALTGGSWQSVLDDCPPASGQHVGLLYDSRRTTLKASATLGALNPRGEPCKDELRPGLNGYFRFPGGLDLSVVAAHLKSGSDARALGERASSFAAFAEAAGVAQRQAADRDVLFIGDMNSMGCEECAPLVSPEAELARTDAVFAGLATPIARLSATPACSHHYRSRSTLLDWAAKSDLAELPAGASLVVSGACGELGCDGLSANLPSQQRLSDHCPIWVDVDDVDRD